MSLTTNNELIDLPVARECDGIIKVGTSEDVPTVSLARDNGNVLFLLPAGDYLFVVHKEGKLVVAIRQDGFVIYGPNMTTDAAAKVFWEGSP